MLIPAEKSSPALLMSTPIPPAAFSAFAMARSIFSSLINAGTSSRTALRAGRPITSPKIRIRMIFDFDSNLKCNPDYLKFLGTKARSRTTKSRQDAKHVLSKVEGAAKCEERAFPLRFARLGAITLFQMYKPTHLFRVIHRPHLANNCRLDLAGIG